MSYIANIVKAASENQNFRTVPPNHIDGTIHKTRVDALNDTKDESFGESIAA